jgi:capsular polysaccharide transport system permease protein
MAAPADKLPSSKPTTTAEPTAQLEAAPAQPEARAVQAALEPVAKPKPKADALATRDGDAASSERKPKPKAEPARELKAPAAPQTQVAQARATKAIARELRRARAKKLVLRLALFVVGPTLVASAYYGAIASPQYESYAMFTIHSAELRPSGGIESLLSVATGGGGRDVLTVRDYVLSRDMLGRLDKEHGFIAHYRSPSVDFFSRLGSSASFEDAYQYFDGKVHADFDSTSGALTLRVRAFTPEKAHEIAQAVLSYSEEMVNTLSARERQDRTQYAEVEVKKMEARLANARKDLLALQQKHGDFNPLATATASMTIRTELEGALAQARAQVMELRAFMNENAPQVLVAQERVKSLSAQVAQESKRLVDPKREGGISGSFGEFEAAMVEKEFAQKAYESALAALELSRSDAARQHRYLATIASPSKPDEDTYPRRLRAIVTVLVVSFLLMGIGTLMSAAVREHARL